MSFFRVLGDDRVERIDAVNGGFNCRERERERERRGVKNCNIHQSACQEAYILLEKNLDIIDTV